MLNDLAILSFVIDIIIIGITFSQMTRSHRFISKKSTMFLIPTFINIYILFVAGLVFDGNGLVYSFIHSIQYSVQNFALNFSYDIVNNALNNSLLYNVAFNIAVILSGLNTIIVVLAFIFGRLINKIKTTIILKNPIVIIGYNENARIFYDSIDSRSKYIIIPNDEDIIRICLRDNIKYLIISSNVYEKFIKINQETNFISFLEDGFFNINLLENFKKISIKYPNYNYKLKVLVNGDNVSTYKSIVSGYTNIDILSEDLLVSKKCLLDNQITNYMDHDNIDYVNATLNINTDINIFMIGFNTINNTLYTQSVCNNQFVKKKEKYESYVPSYYIYDDLHKNCNRQLNYNFNHHKEVCDGEHFPFPDPVEHTSFFNIGLDDEDFYLNVFEKIKNSKSDDLHIFYVNYLDELSNIDIAFKLNQKIKEWKVKGKTKIFVKIEHSELNNISELKDLSNIILFGSKNEILTYPIIVEDSLDEYAKRRALYYKLSHEYNRIDLEEVMSRLESNDLKISKLKNDNWVKIDEYQRKSNISSVLSIFSKLSMLGLELTTDKFMYITEEEYLNIYDPDKFLQSEIIPYSSKTDIKMFSKRKALAFMEHIRWNAFMLVEGYVPMCKNDIKVDFKENSITLYKNDVTLREHACITNDEGLEEYFNYVADLITKCTNYTLDVAYEYVNNRKYDYMLMDTAYSDIKIMNQGIKLRKI